MKLFIISFLGFVFIVGTIIAHGLNADMMFPRYWLTIPLCATAYFAILVKYNYSEELKQTGNK